tara:strand:- start:1660 stop:2103 length:444 start_codon:yes stop_codon:yes gene_type:complete
MKFLKNPYLLLGAVVGGAWLIKNRPKTKAARVATSLKKGAESLLGEAGEFATGIVDTSFQTGQDVWGVFEAGDSEGAIDTAGFDGARAGVSIDGADTDAYVGGDGNTGKAGVDIADTDSMISPDDEGTNGAGFSGEAGSMSFNDYNY